MDDLVEVLQNDLVKEAARSRQLARATSTVEKLRLQKRFERERDHVKKLVQVLAKNVAVPLGDPRRRNIASTDENTAPRHRWGDRQRSARVACGARTETVQDVEFHRYVCRKVAAQQQSTRSNNLLTEAALRVHKSQPELLQEKRTLLHQLHRVVGQQQRKLEDDAMTVRSAVSSFKSLALQRPVTQRYVPFSDVASSS
ncbi:hypothetical protein SDRG_13842 [Saprolegnia diclina VS20]|uniref:Uncharacterized protein n=1 Tax=Saprolegnia diclina (strain VS20) TaxID=1156394 RepID=T0PSP6_SAPDV|nr:hypothetical protein SDRG_13842 [Saprolegnia diclina VS20]EQC28514.1 hypothetical protein SDRG_13842 [Saprolegnia diclina VS20]|eukprot:XP_008618162.1 hypothetical protein SDRG_13842 [Saprolegnia diclina VS20]